MKASGVRESSGPVNCHLPTRSVKRKEVDRFAAALSAFREADSASGCTQCSAVGAAKWMSAEGRAA